VPMFIQAASAGSALRNLARSTTLQANRPQAYRVFVADSPGYDLSEFGILSASRPTATLAKLPQQINDCGAGPIGLDPRRDSLQVWVRKSGAQVVFKAVAPGSDQSFGTSDDLSSLDRE